MSKRVRMRLVLSSCFVAFAGCTSTAGPEPSEGDALPLRAYVVSFLSDELAVINLDDMSLEALVPTGGTENHMVATVPNGQQVFVTSSGSDELIVIDARSLTVIDRIAGGSPPTHINATPAGEYIAVMEEGEPGEAGSVAFVGMRSRSVEFRVEHVALPHYVRYSKDGGTGYVANAKGDFITRVDLETMQVVDTLELEGAQHTLHPEEVGFTDAQVDRDGILYAAHNGSGRVLVYDTVRERRLPDLQVGRSPWVAFASHPFDNVPLRHLVPNLGDQTVSVIDGATRAVLDRTLSGDEEAYGVNYSSRTPNLAFVMLRVGRAIDVVDTAAQERIDRIDVGGNVEVASTTPDGRLIVATVSGEDEVVVIDPVTREIAERFAGVGVYPWSVAIPGGQNYCH